MKFTDYKIGTWLKFAFGTMLTLTILSAAAAIWKLSEVQQNLTDVVTVNNVKTSLNNDMSEQVHIVARVIRTMALLDNAEAKMKEKEKILHARELYDKQWSALQKFPASDAGKQIRARIEQTASITRPLNNKVMELALEGKSAEATALLMNEAGPASQAWQEAIDENLVLQEKANAQEYETSAAAYQSARNLLIALSVASGLIALIMGWFITHGVLSSLGGEPRQAAALAQSISAGDLSASIALRQGDSSSLMFHFKSMQESLARVVARVRQGSQGVSTASAEIASGNNDLSARTEQQASALEETAASMEEFAASVRQNADSARQADQLAKNASAVAAKGGEVVDQVVQTMKGINESSRKISDIISVIDSIAFQTNILALNAAVEAARAGDQGRGFAVVASEVRSLAGRSAEAAKEIKQLINASVERVEQGTDLVDQTGTTMREVVQSIQRVTDIMGEISSASSEQASGVAQIGEAVQQMDQVTQQNAALVEQMAAAASSLKSQASDLVHTVGIFKLDPKLHASLPAPQAAASKKLVLAAAKPVAAPKPVSPAAPKLVTAEADEDWAQF